MLEKNNDKTCLFFASDYHFEMITLPYITKNLKDNKKIIIMTENNLEESMKKVLSRTNLSEETIKQVLEINWNKDDLEKIEKIQNLSQEGKDTIIFVKGRENYINYIDKNINKNIKEKEKIKIIDCFDINEIDDKIEEISEQYDTVLSTTGIANKNEQNT